MRMRARHIRTALLIQLRDKQVLPDQKQHTDSQNTNQKLPGREMLDNQLSRNRDQQNLYNRIQRLVTEHADKLNRNNNIDDIAKKAD